MDFSHSKISLRRPLSSYSKVQYLQYVLYRIYYAAYRFIHGIPALHYGCANNLYKKNGYLFCNYLSRYNSGLFSNVSTALEDIITLYRARINVVRIDDI